MPCSMEHALRTNDSTSPNERCVCSIVYGCFRQPPQSRSHNRLLAAGQHSFQWYNMRPHTTLYFLAKRNTSHTLILPCGQVIQPPVIVPVSEL